MLHPLFCKVTARVITYSGLALFCAPQRSARNERNIQHSRHQLYALGASTVTMIQLKSMLNCIDNSGAAVVECVNVLKMNRGAKIGDRIVVVVQKQRSFGPESGPGGAATVSAVNKVRRGDIRHAVVVRTVKKYQRSDGSVVRFDDNACVLINKAGEPIGSRLNGVVGSELRDTKWSKILSMAGAHL